MDSYQHHQRARWPSLSQGSVDRQRNDRLGRKRRHQLFEHWRAILRGYTNSDTHANSYSYGYSYSYSNGYIHADPNSYSYGNSYIYTDANGNVYSHANSDGNLNTHSNAYTNKHTETNTDAQAAPDCRASAMSQGKADS